MSEATKGSSLAPGRLTASWACSASRGFVGSWWFTFVMTVLACACLTEKGLAAADLSEAFNSCKSNPDLYRRVIDCQEVIAQTRFKKVLLRAHNTRGLALCKIDRCADAVDDFNEVVRLEPSIAGYFDNRAGALRSARRYQEAIADADRAISMAPQYAFLYYGKAVTLEQMGSFAKALNVLYIAKSLEPNNLGVLEYSGKLLGELGRFPEAYDAFNHVLLLDPTASHVYRTRAETERAQGKFREAIADLNRYPAETKEASEIEVAIAQMTASLNAVPVNPVASLSADTSRCRTVSDAVARLSCYDGTSSLPHPSSLPVSPAPVVINGPQPAASARAIASVETPNEDAPKAAVTSLGLSDLPRIADTYKKNQARFFRDFADRPFEATLPLNGIRESLLSKGTYDVSFGEGILGDAVCHIADQGTINMVTDLNKGDNLSISGTIKDSVFGRLLLEDCRIAKQL